MNIAVFPGSFDPLTNGHVALIEKSLPLFDKIVVAVGDNTQKHNMFSAEQRVAWIRDTFAGEPRIKVDVYHELTVDFCRRHGARYLLRGVRNNTDLAYEGEIARVNRLLAPEVETLFLLPDPTLEVVSSTMVRELAKFGKDITPFVPPTVKISK